MKHKDIAIAWLSGKTVQQYLDPDGVWVDLPPAGTSQYCHSFYAVNSYRIKPKGVKMVYYYTNIGLASDDHGFLLEGIEERKYDSWHENTKARYPEVFRQEVELPE